ncbi:glycosyltransferase [Arthrobacter sp. UC242_113]|uniref:glycosyltransferase n=1 Tax=Arthrobacter sp. UC242_113 TaxID=3374550 RepID=UPI0037581C4A
MIILIPACEPDTQLLDVIDAIRAADPALSLVIVDDGSGPAYAQIFGGARRAGAHVISHPANRGKGSALKTGFGFILDRFPGRDVVCADSDGQHSVVDILRVADLAGTDAASMVLGARTFAGDVPSRSRFGNAATRLLFRLTTGQRISDTQTGLRGYPAAMLPWLLTVGGERYEYELNLLLEAEAAGYGIACVGIATIYLDHNSGSHFRPLADSARIDAPLLKFLLSSFAGFLIDTVAFLALSAATDSVLAAVVGARCLSATANYLINHRLVFKHGRDKPARQAAHRSRPVRRELRHQQRFLFAKATRCTPEERLRCSQDWARAPSRAARSSAPSRPESTRRATDPAEGKSGQRPRHQVESGLRPARHICLAGRALNVRISI